MKIPYKVVCLICGKRMVTKETASDMEACKCTAKDLEEFNRKLGSIK